MMIEIKQNGVTLARLIREKDIQEELSFFSDESEFIQVGTWSYNQGKILQRHFHNEVKREVLKTFEVIVVVKGKVLAEIYDSKNNYVDSVEVNEGDTLIQLNSGHGYKILEDNTKVIEVKNGPYFGPELDRTRF